jgi:hypothetical protein
LKRELEKIKEEEMFKMLRKKYEKGEDWLKYETWRDIKDLLCAIFIDFTISFLLYAILEYVINHKII